MTETRAVMLGFGAVAFVLVAVPAYFVWALIHDEPARPSELDRSISKAFLGDEAKRPAFEAPSVPEVERLLPAGASFDAVHATLAASGFACKSDGRKAICSRTVDRYSERTDWTVTLGLDASRRILFSNARWRRTSL